MKRLMAISAAAVVTAGASAQNAVQWRVEDGGNGHWYVHLPVTQSPDWSTAASACLAIGGHLATITSQQENQFVFGLIKPTSKWPNRLGPWLGGYRGPAGWTWVTGEQWSWTNWAPFEPNNTCGGEDKLHFIDFSPTWNDVAANGLACGAQAVWSYVVEWSADCNGDGIVDYGQIQSGQLVDADGNNIPDCCENGSSCCPGDTNNDGFVDGIDLATILTRWAQSATQFPNADCNRDGVIDGSDLSIVLGSWGACP
jgi:hypothetical protein